MNVGDIVMSVANYRLREQILQMISQCSSHHNLNEGCSVGYAGLNQNKLKRVLYATYHSYCGLDRVELAFSTTIGQVIDLIMKKMPVETPNSSTVSQGISYSNSETIGTSSKSPNHSISTSTSAVNMEKRKYEYVIGIDLGHGETSAAICPLQWDTPVEQLDPVKDLEMGGNKKVIPSAITILDNGNAYIGDSAFNPEILKQADVHVCFKKAPKNINGDSEKLMMRFMQEVYRRIRENNSAMLTDDNHLVYIATPSGWDKSTQDLYLQMAKQAGLPMGGITKESRAAFVRAQHDVTSGLGKYVEKGAVVFDMGSSTLDFTYMTSNSKLIDHGYDCGASFIEKTIFKNCEEKFPVIRKFEEKYDRLTPLLLFKARLVKEQVYFDTTLKVKKVINFDEIVEDEDFEDDRYKMVFQPDELDSLLKQVGYIKEIEDAARDFANNHIHNASIYGVFLTGGASRMDFIKPLVSRCWNIPESQIYRDQDPSLTISQGVAEVARMDLRTEGMDEGLEDAINQLQNSDTIYNTFIDKFCYALWDRITDEVGGTVTAFRDAEEDYSLNDLQTAITNNVKEGINEVVPNLSACIQEAITESTQDIQSKVESIISHYSNQGLNIPKPKLEIHEIDTGDVNMDDVISSISEKIASESENWTGAIVGGAIGGAIALLLGGPLAWIIGGAAFLGQLFFGKSDEEKKRDAMMKDLDKEDRAKVFNSIKEEWEKIQKDIDESVYKAVSRNSEIKQSINLAVYQLLQGYKESLKKARILID